MSQINKIPQLIGIKGMMKLFNCGRTTVYTKYVSRLDRYPTKDNKVMFLYSDVLKLKEIDEKKEYNEVM